MATANSITLKARLDSAEREYAEASAELSRASSRAAKARKAYRKALTEYVNAREREERRAPQ